MSDVVDRIAAVLRKHVSAQTENWETKLRCECGQGDFSSKLEYSAHVAERVAAELADHVVDVDTEDDGDPYYDWQEQMSHRARVDRIPYGKWVRQELKRYAELQLTEEWAVDERGILGKSRILGKWHKTQQSAQKHCDTIVRNFWVTHKAVSGAALAEPHPTPVRRWVSAWTAVEEKSL